MAPLRSLFDWLDARTGFRSGRSHLLDEELPAGTGWWFITGSMLMFLLVSQVITGIVLAMYYVPAPEFAYDSVRFIMDRLAFGRTLRGLHAFGASFIVVAAVVHMLRVVLFGSYKQPREVTWLTGVVLLLVILGFALSGYLLPWDQRAYWATTVSINIARSTPVLGDYVAGVMRGGLDVGALTLLRWYAAHVLILPLALVGFVLAHLFLMRRHGISGPVTPVEGPRPRFYPHHAFKDTIAVACVFGALLLLAARVPAPLDAVADPSDATYVPRPEWYFLSLFQMLKYFPGPLEPLATMVIPGVVVGLLLMLPFLDRSPHRSLARRPLVAVGFLLLGSAVVALTSLGLRDTPPTADQSQWSPLAIAGYEFAADERCQTCHKVGGAANPMGNTIMRKDPEWMVGHVRDPEIIAPGVRDVPAGGMSRAQATAIVSYMRKVRQGSLPPQVGEQDRTAAIVYGRYCATCHVIDGEGGKAGPDLTKVGASRDAEWLRKWISDPASVLAEANMPAFGERLDESQMTAIVAHLAGRK